MIKKISPSVKDIESINRYKLPILNNFEGEDYSKVIVHKPWGYEYLLYDNKKVSVWILQINHNQQTSMHCHPNKKTTIFILSGKAEISFIGKNYKVTAGDCFLLGKKVFHRTKALSKKGVLVMELETPVCKKDLIRLSDNYGRENQGYENKNFMVPKPKELNQNLSKETSVGEYLLQIKKFPLNFDPDVLNGIIYYNLGVINNKTEILCIRKKL